MPNDSRTSNRRHSLLHVPLFRLLAINLAIGACAAALFVGGLLWLNPGHLRELIFADRSPGVALAVLLGSFLITFGSAAMGSAIMAQGRREDDGGRGGRRDAQLLTQDWSGQRDRIDVCVAKMKLVCFFSMRICTRPGRDAGLRTSMHGAQPFAALREQAR